MATVPNQIKRRGTLRDLRTAVTARMRSKPTIEGQRYLDLYVLQRDRFRWLRLIQQAERSIQSIDLVLEKIGFGPAFIAAQAAVEMSTASPAVAAAKPKKSAVKRARAA